MLKRLNTDQDLDRFSGQFVPIKLDISTDEYRAFRKDHPPEGKTIPKIIVVRADGETMFAKSTSLRGEALLQLLETCATHSGRILTENEIMLLIQTRENIQRLRAKGDVPGAILQIQKIRKVGSPGEFGTYAQPALQFDSSVAELVERGRESLAQIVAVLDSEEPASEAKLVASLRGFIALSERYQGLMPLREDFAAIGKRIKRNKEFQELLNGVELIEKSYFVSTESAIKRSIEKLDEIVVERKDGPLAEQATKAAERLKKKLDASE